MFGENKSKWLWALALLVVANVAYYIYLNWGLVTVKVHDAPLKDVIHSIERQGWVKIYTNIPTDAKVTMYADHVPLSEALEILSVNVDVPPPPGAADGNAPTPQANGANGSNSTNSAASSAPADTTTNTASANPPPGDRPPGSDGRPRGEGRRGGGGGGAGFRQAQWNLAFFVGANEQQVKDEIRSFEFDNPADDTKVFTYGTQMQFVAGEGGNQDAPDPRKQSWPGYKPPAPAPPPTDATTTDTAATTPPAEPPGPPTAQTYLNAFAQAANVWITAPGSWAPSTAEPPANSSIINAIKKFVSGNHGFVEQAYVLRVGRGGNRGAVANDDSWADRMRNAINGLPPDQRPDALQQLNEEIDFRKNIEALPPDQRRQKFFQHSIERMLYGERLTRLNPVKRAAMYKRMVDARIAGRGH